jgi:transcriptional regulator GlxA family with amidase domain
MDIERRVIDVLLFDDVNLLDVAGPVQAFKEARLKTNSAYQIRFVAVESSIIKSSCGLQLVAPYALALDSAASDLLIPGGDGVDDLLGNQTLQQLIGGWHRARPNGRVISICSGAMLLADAGILDGRTATTHWSRELQAQQLFPTVNWSLDQIFTRDRDIQTSAGVTTGIDLALSLIKDDCGTKCALHVARELVVYLQRSGGQSQYAQILELQFSAEQTLATAIDKLIEQPVRNWTLESMADVVGLTPRTLTRKFNVSLNISPMKFLERLRVRLANDLLSAGMPAARVAMRVGFNDIQTMRRAYKRQLGTTLGEYMERFTQPL